MPIISLCIPTFNRSACLAQALSSIVVQDVFRTTDDLEVVISDNCSSDETEAVAQQFVSQYPDKIRYFRNAENLGAGGNCAMAMLRGTGRYLKLYNDYLYAVNGSLEDMNNVVKAVMEEQPIVFLTNGNLSPSAPIEVCHSINELLTCASYYVTWLASIGFWKSEFSTLQDYKKYMSQDSTQLPQSHFLFGLYHPGRRAIVLKKNYFLILDSGKKTGYNVAEVFGQNYVALLQKYLDAGRVSVEVFSAEKRAVLLNYIFLHYFDGANNLSKTGFFKYMHAYRDEPYFYEELERLLLQPRA